MNPYALSGLLAGIASLSLGLLVLFKSTNKRLGIIWFLFTVTVTCYGFGVSWFALTRSPEQSLFAIRWAYGLGVVWIASLFHHFVCTFLEIENAKSILVNYAISFIFLLILPSRLFFSDAPWSFNSMFFPLGGRLFPVFFAWWMALVFYSHYLLVRAYRDVSLEKKNQIKYFFLATAIGFTGGSTAYLPDFGIYVYPWGNFTVCLYPLIMAYAIVKHRLLDINVIIRKTLVYTLGLTIGIVAYIAFVAHFTHRGIMPLANFSILTSILSLTMALFVFIKAPNRKITILWALTCLSIAAWSLGFGMMTRSKNFEDCIFWQQWFVYVGAILIPVFYLHFVTLLVKADIKWILPASYFAASVFEIVNISGHLATAKIKPPFNFYTEAIYPIYYFYTAFFFVLAIYAHWLLLRRLRTAEGALKNQIQYVFCGTALGFLGGCMTFPLSFNIHIFPIGAYLVVFYIVAVTYAIYKHHLMDINLALRKSLVYSLMTGVLTAIYLITITQGARILQNYFGASAFSISVISACFITAIFLPVRNQVQAFVDRYFFRDWSERGDMVREVAAGFSHELKSPLAGLSMQAQMTLAQLEKVEKDPQSLQEALPCIKEELHYMVNKAMDAARRIEAVRGVAEPDGSQIESVDVSVVLNNSLAAMDSLVKEADVSVRYVFPDTLPPVRGHAKQLEIVFINLIKNALEAMADNKEGLTHALSLVGEEQDGFVSISIKDTGPGIAAKDISRIFEPHFTTKGRKGTGMGLFLSQQIVRSHAGTIEVVSTEGKGTEFIVRLPKYPVELRSGANVAA